VLGSGLDQELEDVTGQLRGWQEDWIGFDHGKMLIDIFNSDFISNTGLKGAGMFVKSNSQDNYRECYNSERLQFL